MENEVFVNGVNFLRAVMTSATTTEGIGLMGGQMVLDNIVDPGLEVLRRIATKVTVKDGIEIDAFSDLLDDETFVISPVMAAAVVKRVRILNRLIDERDDLPDVQIIRLGDQVAAVDENTGEILQQGASYEDTMDGAPDEGNRLAKCAIELYDYWRDVELHDYVGHQLYLLLLMAIEAVDNLLERLNEREFLTGEQADMMNEAYELKDELHDRVVELLDFHPDYGRGAFDCNGDCANCDHYILPDEDD